jgi:hypothetical protein
VKPSFGLMKIAFPLINPLLPIIDILSTIRVFKKQTLEQPALVSLPRSCP